tara:strand:- start:354 stop:551 length:198 start_codon:yes stop_codon:yes gene_type:complete
MPLAFALYPLKINQSRDLQMEIQNNNQKYVAPTITKKKWKKERDVNLEKNLAQTKENRNKRTSKF